MPHHDKLKDLEKQLDRLGLKEEASDVSMIETKHPKFDPIMVAMALGLLGPGSAPTDEEGIEDFGFERADEPEEDSASDLSTSKKDRKAAAEMEKEIHRFKIGGAKVRAKQELDDLLDQIDICEEQGIDDCSELRAKLRLRQLTYERYRKEHAKLTDAKEAKKLKLSQFDDADDDKPIKHLIKAPDVVPVHYKYGPYQLVKVYETPSDWFQAEIITHKMDFNTGKKMYRVRKQDGTKEWYPEYRIQSAD